MQSTLRKYQILDKKNRTTIVFFFWKILVSCVSRNFICFLLLMRKSTPGLLQVFLWSFSSIPLGKNTHRLSKQLHRCYSSLEKLNKNTEIVNPFQLCLIILLKKGKKRHVCLGKFHFIGGTETKHLHINAS